jgi:radical SAM family uncharacterized protein/radical SAM-linked protein
MIVDFLRDNVLDKVQKPGQYLGLEWGAYAKDWDSAKVRMALIYPDLYELGMSNFGLKILYNIVNSHPEFLCDRSYAPMPDMEEQMRKHNLPLWGWESYKPLGDFDLIGISLAYELCYTNVFTIFDLAKIPFYAKNRTNEPLIFAGGPAVFNPEPMANFFDFYIIGDGEDLMIEIPELIKSSRQANPNISRDEILLALTRLKGIYVPRFYEPDASSNSLPKPIRSDVPFPVSKRVTENLDDYNQPVSGPVPLFKPVQDKQVLEIRRGCDRGCRFCQVGYTYLPVRERSPEELLKLSYDSISNSGYDDFTLLSLSASDYTCLTETAKAINNAHRENGIGLSMPSQRVDRFDVELADEITGARKSGMTFAPEAGTERMRRIINKGLSQDDIYKTIKGSYEKGWSHIKLYFMIGLPFEQDEDLDGILDILSWSINMSRELKKQNPNFYKRPLNITCTISTFVPKTFTAFQWFEQCSQTEFKRKQKYLLDGIYQRRLVNYVKLNCTEPEIALIESVLSRGDRRWGEVVKSIWQKGSRFDSWSENFNIDRWQSSAIEHGLDLEYEASQPRVPGSLNCWDHLSIGFTKNFLLDEWNNAVQAKETIPCTENKCHACGVCFNLDVKNVVTKNLSDNNPFVIEIEKEKRQKACAGLFEQLTEKPIASATQDPVPALDKQPTPISSQPLVVVKNTVSQQKLRLKISKLDDLRFIGHLDFQRMVERALRRSGLAVLHSKGYNQRLKMTWGPALPLFIESNGEYIEIELAERYADLENLKNILNQELPKQARILEVTEISPDDRSSISNVLETHYLAKLIPIKEAQASSADHHLSKDCEIDQELIESFLARNQINVTRLSKDKEKIVDIKPQIVALKLIDDQTLELNLRGSQRVSEVLESFLSGSKWKIKKVSQSIN